MKKSYKGAMAASAAGVILLGGAGSLAYWNATGDVPGGDITSGELKLTGGTCGDWLLDGGDTFTPASSKVVPGDSITKTCTFTVVATGDHLTADLSVTQPNVTGDTPLSTDLTASGSYEVGGNAVTQITEANDGDTLEAEVTVTFPIGGSVDNTSQDQTATLSAFTVTATQVHP